MNTAIAVTSLAIGGTRQRARAGIGARIPWDIVAILLIGVVAELLAFPNVDFPSNDDWVYALAVKQILATGIYGAPSPSLPDLVLQAYWGALFCLPFGFSFVALRVSTLVLAAAGLVAAHAFCREIGVSRGLSRVAVLTLALDPLYFHLANSFMTDVPHMALMAISLWAFARGMARDDLRWIGLGIGVALATILVRQFAILLVFALCAARAAERGWSWRSLVALILIVAIGIAEHLLFQQWLVQSGRTPHDIVEITQDIFPPLDFSLLRVLTGHGLALAQYLGLMLSPIYLATGLAGMRRALRDHTVATSVVVTLMLLGGGMVALDARLSLPNYGNVIGAFGLGPLLLRDDVLSLHRPHVTALLELCWSVARWLGIAVAAAVAVDFVELLRRSATALLRRRPDWRAIVPLALIGGYGAATLLMATAHGAFDRYLLSLMLPLVMVAVHQTGTDMAERGWRAAAAIVLAAFAAFSIAGVHDYWAFQRARLAASDRLEAAGVTPAEIEGGYEYDGFRRGRREYQRSLDASDWWKQDYPYVIASTPLPGYRVDARYPFRHWLTGEHTAVLALKRVR